MRVFGREVAYKWVVAVVYVAALFLDIIDTTVVNVALPSLGRELHSNAVEWVVVGYTLSLAVWIPASGWLGDRLGTKKVFLFALGAFTFGSLACGLAQNIGQLIAFRVLQGVGGGMLTPVGIAMLFRAFPPAERAKASTVVMIPTLVAPAAGPVLGGWITTNFSWRWIFLVNVPIALVALWFGARHLREHKEPTAGRLDIAGLVLSGGFLASTVYALSEGPIAGWTSNRVLGFGALGLLLGLTMVVVELRVPFPLLELRLLGNRLFRQCNLVSFFAMAGFLGVMYVLPQYLQILRGLSPLSSGLTTFPQAFGVMMSSFIAGRIYAKIGPRRLMFGGFFAAAISIVLYTQLTLDTNLWLIRGLMFLRGLCTGFAFLPMQAASYATIPPSQNGRASSLFTTQRQVGVSMGVAVLASILASYGLNNTAIDKSNPAVVDHALHGVRVAFWAAVIFSLISAAMTLRIRDDDAKGTMAKRAA